jgi:hypothetical protein
MTNINTKALNLKFFWRKSSPKSNKYLKKSKFLKNMDSDSENWVFFK